MKKIRTVFLCIFCVLPVSAAHAQTENVSPSTVTRPRVVSTPAPGTPPPKERAAPSPTPAGTLSTTTSPAAVPTVVMPPASATPSPPAAPTLAPSAPPVNLPIVLQPASLLAVNKVRAKITEAQREFKTRAVPTAFNPSFQLVTLAVLEPDSSDIHTLTLPKETFLQKGMEVTLSSSRGKLLRLRVVRPNYVNTAVIVSDLTGQQFYPLVLEYPIEKRGLFKEMAYYTSAHPALLSPELVRNGQAYVRTMIDLAAKRLKDKGHTISPQLLDMAERLCLVEHVDHDRFRKENRRAVYEEVFALFALNELDTYKYSVSSAGAGGMVQMIPATYAMMRRHYPAIGLNPDFVLGMRNHGNALEAMLLYMHMTWRDLSLNEDVIYAMSSGWATQPELLAAGYNSNPARLPLYIRRGGVAWKTLIPRETQMYLQILNSIESLIPMKPRE